MHRAAGGWYKAAPLPPRQREGGCGGNLGHRPAQRWGLQSTGSSVAASLEGEILRRPRGLAGVKGAKSIHWGGGSLLVFLWQYKNKIKKKWEKKPGVEEYRLKKP